MDPSEITPERKAEIIEIVDHRLSVIRNWVQDDAEKDLNILWCAAFIQFCYLAVAAHQKGIKAIMLLNDLDNNGKVH